ncbi:MAG: RNA pseudouridine synthase [Deltaproteobacteria bacterium]|nr:RNA pseudouridine synthase [Deltaproteobacteria bacterium]
MEPRILGEAAGLVFVWKPPGMPVYPLEHDVPGSPSLLGAVRALLPASQAESWPKGFEGGIAHRLDNGTSGLVVVAGNLDALDRFRGDLAARRVIKTYRFVTDRTVPWQEHVTDVPLGHDRHRRGRMVPRRGAATPHRGRWYEARTWFRRLGPFTWEARIRTGVTHQVRLHAAWVGLALTGDRAYGGHPFPEDLADRLGHPPVPFLLHHIGDVGPGWTSPEAPLPAVWDTVVGRLGGGQG